MSALRAERVRHNGPVRAGILQPLTAAVDGKKTEPEPEQAYAQLRSQYASWACRAMAIHYWDARLGMHDAAWIRQYQTGEDVEKQCLAGTWATPAPCEFAVERIGEVLAVGVAKRGRAASVDTTAA